LSFQSLRRNHPRKKVEGADNQLQLNRILLMRRRMRNSSPRLPVEVRRAQEDEAEVKHLLPLRDQGPQHLGEAGEKGSRRSPCHKFKA
jgi:hypothetical protein